MKKSWWFGSIVVVIVFLWSPMLLAEAENQDPGPSDPWYCSWIGCDDGYHWWCPGSCRGGQTPSMRTCSEQATGETDEQRLESCLMCCTRVRTGPERDACDGICIVDFNNA